MGISALIPCKSSFDFWCMLAKSTAQRGVYTRWAQENLIQVRHRRVRDACARNCFPVTSADNYYVTVGWSRPPTSATQNVSKNSIE